MAILIAFAAHSYYGPATMPYYNGWWLFPFGFFFFIIIVFFISRLLFWPWGWGWGRRGGYWYGYGDPKDIIKRRYARGEITKDQFDQMMRDLEQHA